MNLLHPKALPVSNLMEGFLEEMRERNLRNVIEFHKQSQQSMQNGKVVTMRGEPLVGALITPLSQQRQAEKRSDNMHSYTHLLMTKPNNYEGEAVSPAAPLKPSDPVRGIVIGIIFGGIFWGGLFLVRWFIRLCS